MNSHIDRLNDIWDNRVEWASYWENGRGRPVTEAAIETATEFCKTLSGRWGIFPRRKGGLLLQNTKESGRGFFVYISKNGSIKRVSVVVRG